MTRPPPPPPPVTRPPFKGDEYIPPQRDNEIPQPSNNNNNIYLPPNRGEDNKSPLIPGESTNTDQTIVRPPQNDEVIPLPPIQCPAATNCTEIQFCSAEGVISKSPVILTPDQETFRVPLSDCRDLSRGITGKCCRDSDYVDPWPTSILGQYNATILGFDDGSYKPDASAGQPARLTQAVQRGQGQLSLPIPAQSQSTYSRTPFLQGVNSQYNKSPNTPEPNSISQREKPVTNKYQTSQQQHNVPNQPQQHQSTVYPVTTHPLIQHEVSELQKQRQPQQPIVHRHVQRQSEPTQSFFNQPQIPQFSQIQTLPQPVSQQQFPFTTQQYTPNPSDGVCATRDTVSVCHWGKLFATSFELNTFSRQINCAVTDPSMPFSVNSHGKQWSWKNLPKPSSAVVPLWSCCNRSALCCWVILSPGVCGKPQYDACDIDMSSAEVCTRGDTK